MRKLTLLSLLLLCSIIGASAQTKVKTVFLTGGQSNTEGRISNSTLTGTLAYLNAPISRCQISNSGTWSESSKASFSAYDASVSGFKWAYDGILYYWLAKNVYKDAPFYVVKSSYGGTSIDPSVSNSGSTRTYTDGTGATVTAPYYQENGTQKYGNGYHWSADPTFLGNTDCSGAIYEKNGTKYTGQSMLKTWIAHMDAAIDSLAKDGSTVDIKAIVWHQGESDKYGVYSSYYTNLKNMVAYIRQHLVEKTGDSKYATLPFYCGTIPHASSLYNSTIEKAFFSLDDEDPNFHAVDLRDLTMLSDVKHFDAPSAELFGKRLYNRMIGSGLITADSLDVKDAETDYSDFGSDEFVGETTTWTFDDKSGSFYSGSQIVNHMYLHGGGSTQRRFEFNAKQTAQTLTYPDGTATSTSYVRSNLGSQTAATNVSDSWNASRASGNCMGINVKYPGTLTLQVALEGTSTFSVCFNGKVIKSIKGVTDASHADADSVMTGVITPLTYTASKAGTYYVVCTGAYKLWGARYTTATDRTVERKVTTDADGYATYGNLTDANVGLPDSVKAYVVTASTTQDDAVVLTEVASINNGNAVLLKGKPNTEYTLPFAWEKVAEVANEMTAQKTTGAVVDGKGTDFINYTYADKKFRKGDGTVTVNAGNAFLAISDSKAQCSYTTLSFEEPKEEEKELVLDYTEKSFGTDAVVSDSTTWTFNDKENETFAYSSTVNYTALFKGTTLYNKMYVHSYGSNSRGYHGATTLQSLTFSDKEKVNVTQYMYCTADGNGGNKNISASVTASKNATNSVAINATLPGTFYGFVSANTVTGSASYTIYFNGEAVKTLTVTGTTPAEIKYLGTSAGTYYLYGGSNQRIFALRYTPIPKPVTGDVNGDGQVNISDVNAVISVMCGDKTYESKADVNGDGQVNISDVNAVITIMCGGTL